MIRRRSLVRVAGLDGPFEPKDCRLDRGRCLVMLLSPMSVTFQLIHIWHRSVEPPVRCGSSSSIANEQGWTRT